MYFQFPARVLPLRKKSPFHGARRKTNTMRVITHAAGHSLRSDQAAVFSQAPRRRLFSSRVTRGRNYKYAIVRHCIHKEWVCL